MRLISNEFTIAINDFSVLASFHKQRNVSSETVSICHVAKNITIHICSYTVVDVAQDVCRS